MKHFFAFLLLLGCYGKEIKPLPEKPKLKLEVSKQLNLNKFMFVIITNENFASYINENAVYYCLDADDYKLSAENLKQIIDYIKLQKEVILQYKQYYEKE